MPKYRVTRAAEVDLLSIGRYTETMWGTRQRQIYLSQLDARMQALARNPKLGSARDEIHHGYRSFHEGRHVLFYREVDDTIEVVRVLHDSMDVTERFDEPPEGD